MLRKLTIAILFSVLLFGCAGSRDYELIGYQGESHFVVVEYGMGLERLKEVSNIICQPHETCVVLFWNNESQAGTRMPLTDAQVSAQVAHYNRNASTGMDRLLMCESGKCK